MRLLKRLTSISLATLFSVTLLSPESAAQQTSAQRTFQPEDLFRVQQIGAIAWSPDGRYAAIEISKSDRTLDRSVPSGEIQLLDVRKSHVA